MFPWFPQDGSVGIAAEQVLPVAQHRNVHGVAAHSLPAQHVERQVGQVEIFQPDRAGSVGVGNIFQYLIGPPGDFTRFRIDDLFVMLYPLLAVTGFGFHLLRQRVLFFKQAIQEAVHAVNFPLSVGMG